MACRRSTRRAQSSRRAPCRANSIAAAPPIPALAPVMNTSLPLMETPPPHLPLFLHVAINTKAATVNRGLRVLMSEHPPLTCIGLAGLHADGIAGDNQVHAPVLSAAGRCVV